jgi:hypothetical protein
MSKKTLGEIWAEDGEASKPRKKARPTGPKTPREIQAAELKRRRDNRQTELDVGEAKPFIRTTIAASPSLFCWFCFENDLDLLVAGISGVAFCRPCAQHCYEHGEIYKTRQENLP